MPPVGAAFPGGYPFHRLAADLIGIADGTYGLRCLHVNVFFSSKAPDTSDACLRDHRKCRAVDLAAADPVHWESKQADQVLRIFARLAPGLQLCGNQPCVGCTAPLTELSGERPAPPRLRADVASMAWRLTRRFSTKAP